MKNENKKIDVLIIASQLTESNFLLLKKIIFKKSFLFLALDPESHFFLKNKHENYITSKDIFNNKTDKSILLDSQKILKKYENGISLIKIDGINDCFKNYINFHLLFKIREWVIIHHMIKEINMKEIIYGGSDNFIFSILIKWSDGKKIILRSIKKIVQISILTKYKTKILNFIHISIFEMLLLIYKLFFKNQNKNQIFITGPDHNLSEVVNKTKEFNENFLPVYLISSISFFYKNKSSFLKGNFFSFRRVFGLITPKYKKDFLLFKENIDKAILVFKEIETSLEDENYLYSELNQFMYYFLKNNCFDLFRSYIGLNKIFENNTNKLFLIAQHALGFNGLAGEFSNTKNIPSMLITHGSHIKQNNKYSKLCWDEINKTLVNAKFTFSAMQTPLAYDYFINEKNKKAKALITGPMIFGLKKASYLNKIVTRDSLFRANSKKFIFLHAGTPKQWNFFRPIIYESLDEYISNLIDIINAVKINTNIFLAIRYRETKNLSLSLLKQLLPKHGCYEIYTEGDFSDYLTCSDFLISYSSTTIEEALINKKPVLLYNPKGHYFHIKGLILDKKKYPKTINTVYNIESKNNLIWGLNWLMSNHLNKQKTLNWDKYSFDKNKTNSYYKIIQRHFQN